MQKEALRKLKALPATKEMMEKGRRFIEKTECHSWYNEGKPYRIIVPEYDVLLRVQNLEGFVKVAVFLPKKMRENIKTPLYEIFLNVKGGEYITRVLDDEGNETAWSSAIIGNLRELDFDWNYQGLKVFVSNDGMHTLNALKLENDNKHKGIYRLKDWQQEQKNADTKRKEQREQAPWDADMKLVPKLAPGFEEWMRRDVVKECFIIYEYHPKGQTAGYCSRCKKMVPIKEPKHGKATKCPACKAKALFKAHTRLQTLATSEYHGEIIQRFNGGIVIRSFAQKQWYGRRDYRDPEIRTTEFKRVLIFDDGKIKKYDWTLYKNKYIRWIQDKSYFPRKENYIGWMKLYKRNLTQLKKHSLLKQSAIDLWPELPSSVTNYLELEKGNPAVEMLARLGMFRLAREIIEERYDSGLFDENATELSKMLKIDKSRLKRLKEMDANLESLRWMQYEKIADTIWPDEMIKDFGEANFPTSAFNFLYAPIGFVKCHNYLKKQAAIMDESMKQVLITWRDYINMADRLKMNTKCDQIAKPKDLKVAHDELVLLIQSKGLEKQAEAIEKKWPKVNGQLPKLQKFEFTLGEYTIVAPKSVLDIVTEGTILKHCVHTCDYYFSRIQTDESYLFFLRRSKQPDMPWYTLEVEPSGNIRQKRTTGDNQNADFQKAVPFLKKWQQYFNKQLTEEEKKLGEIANELREENYKKLRKNGNKVWHGKLAGKLLADVLEQDFMAAVGGM